MKGNFSLLNVHLSASLRLGGEWRIPTPTVKTAHSSLLSGKEEKKKKERKKVFEAELASNYKCSTSSSTWDDVNLAASGTRVKAGSSPTWWATDDIYCAAPPLFLFQATVIKARTASWLVPQSQLCLQHRLTFPYRLKKHEWYIRKS